MKPASQSKTIWQTWLTFLVDSGMITMVVAVDWTALGVQAEAAAGIAILVRLAGAAAAHWRRLHTAEGIQR